MTVTVYTVTIETPADADPIPVDSLRAAARMCRYGDGAPTSIKVARA